MRGASRRKLVTKCTLRGLPAPSQRPSRSFGSSSRSAIFLSSRPKKHPNTKISPRIPCLNPPFSGAFNPRNSLCSGCVFSLKCRKNADTKNFEGGRWGAEKNLCVRFLWVLFFRFLSQSCGSCCPKSSPTK